MKKICIVGTIACGSTRLFNLVRLLYEKKGQTVYSRWNIKDVNELEKDYDVILCKIHDVQESDYLDQYDMKLMPIRNILDAAISTNKRFPDRSHVNICHFNINMFRKFQSNVNLIFRYEDFSIFTIQELCKLLQIDLRISEIIEIMRELETMLHDKTIVKIDDHDDETYQKTLLSQDHNTSNGKSNKFIFLEDDQIEEILNDTVITNFLMETKYL
jgi:hypothetical protein